METDQAKEDSPLTISGKCGQESLNCPPGSERSLSPAADLENAFALNLLYRADYCCTQTESDFGLFSFAALMSYQGNDSFGYTREWSVIPDWESSDAKPDENAEIDLLEVEEAGLRQESDESHSEARVKSILETKSHPSIQSNPSLPAIKEQPAEIFHLSENGIRFNLFADLEKEWCQKATQQRHSHSYASYSVPDIPVFTNKKIEAFIRLYTQKKRAMFMKALDRYPKYEKMILETLTRYELPLNLAYLAVVESNLNPNARSRANAVGLWQFMSYTGKHFGLSRSWWHDDRYDPTMSTEAAAKYLKRLHRQFKGDWELALAAYNSGSGTVSRAMRRAKASGKATDYWSLRLPRETRGYVPAFYAVSTIFSNLEKYGFKPLQPAAIEEPKQHLQVGGGISLNQLAKLLNLDRQELSDLNPRLRFKGLTPPTHDTFTVRIPASVKLTSAHQEKLEALKANREEEWKIHEVKQGETLWSISRYYRIPMGKILAFNHLRRKNLLRIGQKLMLPIPVDWSPPKQTDKTKLAVVDLEKIPGVTKIHVVQKGETLWRISQMYDVPIKKIKHWNRRVLRKKYLKIGTEIVLKVPASITSNSI